MLRTLFSFRGLILVFGLVAVGLPVALVAQLGIVRTLTSINFDIGQIRRGQLVAAMLLQDQVDEESGVRGYAATGRRVFLEPYQRAIAALPRSLDALAPLIDEPAGASDEQRRALDDLRRVNAEWLRTIAPIVSGKRHDEALLLQGKTQIDRFRHDLDPITRRFSERYRHDIERRDRTIATTTAVALLAIAVIALEVIVFAIVVARMRFELDRERGFVETLQTAASVRLVSPAHLAVGSVYRSATRGTRIGGDVYDVYRLGADRTLLVVGDVSGKGLAAAVDTTFVRFALRTLASGGIQPHEMVRRFDALYRDANGAPEAFVTMFVGVHDRRTGSLAYANAGHEACWVRRGDGVTILPPTGPIVGLGIFEGLHFGLGSTPLAVGDTLVLATDGLTEARDPQRRVVPIEDVTAWIAGADARTPQALVDALLTGVKRYTRGRITDDLAILAVRPLA
ncbi:MAG: SpoIIE family protein phosphatase [Candidatus Elarobacter sp.]